MELGRIDPPGSAAELADYLDDALRIQRKYNELTTELDAPEELEDLHERGVRLARRLDEDFARVVERVRRSDEPAVALQREVKRLLPEIREVDRLNRELGADDCLGEGLGQPPADPT